MSIRTALVIGASGQVGRATATALADHGTRVVAAGRERDATDPAQVAALLDEADPDLVVIAAGVAPHVAPIDEQTWETFSTTWNSDVRIAFEVGRAALMRPLREGAAVVVVSSGAGLGGSPLSGGYAGAKRMQMFLADYFQRTSDARGLGIRFVALAPRQFLVGTPIGHAAAAAYGAQAGQSAEAHMKERFPAPLDPDGVASAILEIAWGDNHHKATLLAVTGEGLEVI